VCADVFDSMKASVSKESAGELMYCKRKLVRGRFVACDCQVVVFIVII